MARGKRHDRAVRDAAEAALLAGQSIDAVAADQSLSRDTVRVWSDKIKAEGGESYDEKLGHCMTEGLATLAAQQRLMRDPEWLRKQNARDLALMHGGNFDVAFRVASARNA